MEGRWSDDAELARRIASGDSASLTALVESLHRPLLRVAEAWLGPGAAAEDLVQETWEAVIDHIDGFQARASLRTWITRILVNRAKTQTSRAKRFTELERLDRAADVPGVSFNRLGFSDAPLAYATGPEEALVQLRARHWLAEALAALPPTQRAVVTLRDVEEWTSKEVCNVLGISESNQRVLLHRGRAKLRAALAEVLAQERHTC